MTKNLVVTEKINELLNKKNLTGYKLSQMIGITHGALYSMIKGNTVFSEDLIQKIAPILEISPEEIKGWILADKYPKNILEMAVKIKQETPKKGGKLILTAKIDKILQNKGISRTGLSKLINYSQGKLNEMIKGVEPMSPLVISKIAPILEVSEDEITSWIVADKYSVEVLRVGVETYRIHHRQ